MVYLISKDSKGKIRVVELDLINNKSNYTISRTTYQYQGKKTPHTDIVITEGKAKRTLLENKHRILNLQRGIWKKMAEMILIILKIHLQQLYHILKPLQNYLDDKSSTLHY